MPRDDLAPRRVAERSVGRHGVGGRPDVDTGRIVEIGGHHPDDGEAPFAQRDAPAEDGGRSGEPRPPQVAPNHEHRLGAVDVVGRQEDSTDDRRDAEHLEERSGDQRAVDGRSGAVLRHHDASDAVRVDAGHSGEMIDVGRGAGDGAIAERMMGVAGRRQITPRDDQLPLIVDRQRPEQDAADQREHEDAGGGPGRERQDGGDGEGARPEEAARDPSGVLAPGAEHAPRCHLSEAAWGRGDGSTRAREAPRAVDGATAESSGRWAAFTLQTGRA